ncbi:CPK3 [Symbiodinium natans]|uniref:CPK3 protein n=1 Tax=Symbiodinium natans TaxID=878477 RepID=A0A812NMW6_9DINO|nr:CPK3 [Symbiodinium natans]
MQALSLLDGMPGAEPAEVRVVGFGWFEVRFTTVISACSKGSEWEVAMGLLRSMARQEVEPDAICYAAAVAHVQGGDDAAGFADRRGALAMLKELWIKRLQPERESLRAAALEIAGTTAFWADSARSTAEGALQGIIDEAGLCALDVPRGNWEVLGCSEDGTMGVWLFNVWLVAAESLCFMVRLFQSLVPGIAVLDVGGPADPTGTSYILSSHRRMRARTGLASCTAAVARHARILAGASGSQTVRRYPTLPTLIQRQDTKEEAAEATSSAPLRRGGEDLLNSLVPVPNAAAESAGLQSPPAASLRTPSDPSKPSLASPREVKIHFDTPRAAPATNKAAGDKTGQAKEVPSATSAVPVPSMSPGKASGRPRASKVVNRKAFQACRQGDVGAVYAWDQRKSLGGGSYGEVFAVKHRFNVKKRVAIKQVGKAGCDDLPRLRMEISVLSSLDHPRVLHFIEAYEDYKDVYIVTELCTGGDLHSCLTQVRGDTSFTRHAANQILRALVYCHSKGVCHRDLKPENVLLVRKLGELRDPPMRLADFGLARQIKAHKRNLCDQISHVKSRASDTSFHDAPPLHSFVGTAEYMAPEVMAVLNSHVFHVGGKSYDFRCDLWSLGVIMHVILVGELPYSLEELHG